MNPFNLPKGERIAYHAALTLEKMGGAYPSKVLYPLINRLHGEYIRNAHQLGYYLNECGHLYGVLKYPMTEAEARRYYPKARSAYNNGGRVSMYYLGRDV